MKTIYERIDERMEHIRSIPLTPDELGEVLIETMGGGYVECKIALKRLWKAVKLDDSNEARRLIINIEKYLKN